MTFCITKKGLFGLAFESVSSYMKENESLLSNLYKQNQIDKKKFSIWLRRFNDLINFNVLTVKFKF